MCQIITGVFTRIKLSVALTLKVIRKTKAMNSPKFYFAKSSCQKTLITSTALLSCMVFIALSQNAQAQSFTVPENGTLIGNQRLGPGDTGTIESGGLLQNNGTAISIAGGGASTVINNGSIVSTIGRGVDIGNGPGSTVINNGTITTNNAEAILADSLQSGFTIVNTGTLITTGGSSETFDLGGDSSTFDNSGAIINNGNSPISSAVRFRGDNNTGVNSGTISSTGDNGTGLSFSGGDNNTFANTGTITASGVDGVAVNFFGSTTNTFTNNGIISATGGATQAIVGGAGGQTLNLGAGSQIIGAIDLGGGIDTVNILGNGPSSVLTFTNTENINLAGNVSGVVIGDTASIVDSTGQAFLAQTVSTVNTAIHNTIHNRVNANFETAPQTVSSNTVSSKNDENTSSASFFGNNRSGAWAGVFGSTLERDGEGAILSYKQNYYGLIGGYELDTDFGQLGFVGGFSSSAIETNVQSIDTDVLSFFGGVYGQFPVGAATISSSLIGGYESYDNDRTVTNNLGATETASSDFNNIFISASLGASAAYKLNQNFELRPSGALTYTASFFDNYTESGTTSSNLSIDSRTVQTLNIRAQMAGAFIYDNAELELRTGFDGRFSNDGDIGASLAGTNFQFAASDDDSVEGGFVGIGLKIDRGNGFTFVADTEYRKAGGGEDQFSGRLIASYSF